MTPLSSYGRGLDGDHFVFLTNGDTVDSLEEAPIFFIQPMSFSDPFKPVAKNLKEFLALYIQLKELYLFEWLPSCKTEEEFLQHYKDVFEDGILEYKEEKDIITSAIQKKTLKGYLSIFSNLTDCSKRNFKLYMKDTIWFKLT